MNNINEGRNDEEKTDLDDAVMSDMKRNFHMSGKKWSPASGGSNGHRHHLELMRPAICIV